MARRRDHAGDAVTTERRARVYAVKALRKLGRDLTSGEWSGDEPMPLSAEQALAVMGRAMVVVVRLGVASAVNALDDALRDLLPG